VLTGGRRSRRHFSLRAGEGIDHRREVVRRCNDDDAAVPATIEIRSEDRLDDSCAAWVRDDPVDRAEPLFHVRGHPFPHIRVARVGSKARVRARRHRLARDERDEGAVGDEAVGHARQSGVVARYDVDPTG
jgi:hypothetical protein